MDDKINEFVTKWCRPDLEKKFRDQMRMELSILVETYAKVARLEIAQEAIDSLEDMKERLSG